MPSQLRPSGGLAQQVGRLQRLAVFEASARLGSFTAAGAELGVSQPAVTRQIRLFEQSIGHELFDRSANRIQLTHAGTFLAEAIVKGFDHINQAIAELTHPNDGAFVLACHPGFAQQWLMPRIDQVQQLVGGRQLQLRFIDSPADLRHASFDAAIHVSDSANQPTRNRLFGEVVVPIASPQFADQLGLDENTSPETLLSSALLHMDDGDQPWLSWTGWFAHFGLKLLTPYGQVLFNNYPMVIQQAIAGRGIALGWQTLIDALIADNILVAISTAVSTKNGYYLTSSDSAPQEEIGRLGNWLHEQFRKPHGSSDA
jgi:LysR family transcriptional regulator, glycine cleavage system transcriptional activator